MRASREPAHLPLNGRPLYQIVFPRFAGRVNYCRGGKNGVDCFKWSSSRRARRVNYGIGQLLRTNPARSSAIYDEGPVRAADSLIALVYFVPPLALVTCARARLYRRIDSNHGIIERRVNIYKKKKRLDGGNGRDIKPARNCRRIESE